MRTIYHLLFISIIMLFIGCQEESPSKTKTPPQSASPQKQLTQEQPTQHAGQVDAGKDLEDQTKKESAETETAVEQSTDERVPPTPPVLEDFQGQPKLSLFPRVGDFQPPLDSDQHPYWRTFIDHLVKVTGVAENQDDGSRGWVFRSVNTIDSVGYFAPLAVKPNTTYNVSFKLTAELPAEASAGIGALEFNEFLWIGEQYTEETFKKHYRGVHEGKRLTGNQSGNTQTFTITTGPDTNMIHLILFREGAHDRNALMFDNIEIK